MFDRLGRLVLRLRFVLLIGWLVAAALFGVLAPSLSQVGSADETSFLPKDAESLAALQVLNKAFPSDSAQTTALIVFSRPGGLTDADRLAIEGLQSYFEGSGHPDTVVRYVTAENTPSLASMFRSSDGVVELAQVDMSTPSFLPRTNAAIDVIRAHLADSGVLPKGLSAQVTGQAGIGRDYLQAIQDGTSRTTLVTILLVVLVLLLIYRAPLAALAPLIRLRYADGAVRVSDLDQLVAIARGAEDIRHFVSELVLDPPSSSADLAGPPHLDEDYLVLSTVHSAKGLEWDAVHLIAAYDGNFPADMSTATEEGIAEERRLFYVALTRARRRLHVYVPRRYYHRPHGGDDAHGYGQASRFLTDAVQALFSITRTVDSSPAGAGDAAPERRIAVSVDALF